MSSNSKIILYFKYFLRREETIEKFNSYSLGQSFSSVPVKIAHKILLTDRWKFFQAEHYLWIKNSNSFSIVFANIILQIKLDLCKYSNNEILIKIFSIFFLLVYIIVKFYDPPKRNFVANQFLCKSEKYFEYKFLIRYFGRKICFIFRFLFECKWGRLITKFC